MEQAGRLGDCFKTISEARRAAALPARARRTLGLQAGQLLPHILHEEVVVEVDAAVLGVELVGDGADAVEPLEGHLPGFRLEALLNKLPD